MDKYSQIKQAFQAQKDKENAIKMSKYMRNQFEYYGILTPKRKAIYNHFIKIEKKNKEIDWNFLDQCYKDDHREFQYLVYDYLFAMKNYLTYDDIDKIKNYITTKSWWDTIDFLCKIIGYIGLKDKRVKDLMLDWSTSDNIWLKRTAIEHQLCLKDKTDVDLLNKIIINCLGSNEFFINKAIGWALRDYSKTDSIWVNDFINMNRDKMDHLSIKEASKYI